MATQLTNLSNFADQLNTLQLPNSQTATLELVYMATTERWIFNLTYPSINFTVNGVGLCCYPNMLRQWNNILPFGLACTTSDQTDPVDVNDFVSGRVSLFLLTQSDVAAIESTIFGGPQV